MPKGTNVSKRGRAGTSLHSSGSKGSLSESKGADTEHKETAPAINRHPVAGTHLLKHHCHWVMKMATIFT